MTECLNVLAVGSLPLTSTSYPPDVIHVKNAPRPSPFFFFFCWSSALVYYCERKWKVKTGEAWFTGHVW